MISARPGARVCGRRPASVRSGLQMKAIARMGHRSSLFDRIAAAAEGAYKPLDMAQARWRRLDGASLLPLVRTGISFVDGVQHEGKINRTKARAA